jgi:hypothetical protein
VVGVAGWALALAAIVLLGARVAAWPSLVPLVVAVVVANGGTRRCSTDGASTSWW